MAAGLVLLTTLAWRDERARASESSRLDPNVVAVAPFRTGGADPALGYLREGMLDLLAGTLTGDGGPRATDPRTLLQAWRRIAPAESADVPGDAALQVAHRLGAGRLLLGSVVGTPGRLVVTASLLRVPDGAVRAVARAEGPQDSLSSLVDRLAGQLLVREAGEAERLTPLARVPLPALRAYLAGQAAYRRTHFTEAADHFERALQTDSTFVLAALGLSASASWPPAADRGGRAAALAWPLRSRLSGRDRALLLAYLSPGYPSRFGPGATGEILAGWERALEVTPDRAETWFWVGDLLFHYGPTLAVTAPMARARTALDRALALDSSFTPALDHLLQLALAERDTAAVRRYAALYFARDSTGDDAGYLRWHTALALGDAARLAAVRAGFDQLTPNALRLIVGMGMQLVPQHDGVLRDVERAASALERRPGTPAAVVLPILAANGGRPPAARYGSGATALRRHRQALVVRALYWDGDSAAAAAAVPWLAPSVDAPPVAEPGERNDQIREACLVAQWRLGHGDTRAARRAIDGLRKAGAGPAGLNPDQRLCQALLDAQLATLERRADARRLVERLDTLALASGTFIGGNSAVPALGVSIARLRAAHGDLAGALAAVRRRPNHPVQGSVFLTSHLREEARLAAAAGDTAGAIRAYRHFLALRSAPGPRLAADAAVMRSELARLERRLAAR